MKKLPLSLFSILLTGAFLYGAVTVTDGKTSVSIDFNSNSSVQSVDQTSTSTQDDDIPNFASKLDQQKKKHELAAPIVGTSSDI